MGSSKQTWKSGKINRENPAENTNADILSYHLY